MAESMTDANTWKPHGATAWLLTLAACLVALLMAGLAYCMLSPVRWDGPGQFGAPGWPRGYSAW
jgi:hypothetical protein